MSLVSVGTVSESTNGESTLRLDIGALVARFQKLLPQRWDDYQTAISLFLLGKLSRDEMLSQIAFVLNDNRTRQLHNQLLATMLANAYRSDPLDGISEGGFGSQKRRKNMVKSSQWETVKRTVMSLPIREKLRIKSITRESGKKGLSANIIVQTRQAIVPKVPLLPTTDPESQNKNLARTMVSVKDILDLVNSPLMTETYELPERTMLRDQMIGHAREHGVLGSVSMKAVDVLLAGLQYHLKTLISNAMDNVGARRLAERQEKIYQKETNVNKKRKRVTLTLEDMYDSFALAPHLIEPYGPMEYLTDSLLKNDDDYDFISRYHTTPAQQGDKIFKVPEGRTYVIPQRVTPVSYLLKPKTENQPINGQDKQSDQSVASQLGTENELNWLINDLLAEDS
ncbi:Hfi1 protein [Martiniozyma asiatica (nom. inval.)]|nr:Hfi1 protein [Martiniozyma asiatica]